MPAAGCRKRHHWAQQATRCNNTRRVRTRTASASHPARSAAAAAHRAPACARCRAYPSADSRRSRTSSERCLAWTWAWLSNMRRRGNPSLTTLRRTCGEGCVACGLIFCRPGGEGRHTANVPAPIFRPSPSPAPTDFLRCVNLARRGKGDRYG